MSYKKWKEFKFDKALKKSQMDLEKSKIILHNQIHFSLIVLIKHNKCKKMNLLKTLRKIDDFNIVWAKLDKIMNSTSTLFKIQNRYYVNKDEWMEIQGKISEAQVMDGTMYQMEAGVEKYWCDTQDQRCKSLG